MIWYSQNLEPPISNTCHFLDHHPSISSLTYRNVRYSFKEQQIASHINIRSPLPAITFIAIICRYRSTCGRTSVTAVAWAYRAPKNPSRDQQERVRHSPIAPVNQYFCSWTAEKICECLQRWGGKVAREKLFGQLVKKQVFVISREDVMTQKTCGIKWDRLM